MKVNQRRFAAGPELSDEELLASGQRAPEAFGAFYERHCREMLGFFYRRTASPETAADLTAETFAQAYLSLRRYRRTGAPAVAWLQAIARHQLSRYFRSERIESRGRRRLAMSIGLELSGQEIERIEQMADAESLKAQLKTALETLPPGWVEAVRLRVVMELPYEEVARKLGCSEGAARVRVSRALSRLADQMEAV